MPTFPAGLTEPAFAELRKATAAFDRDLYRQAVIVAHSHHDSDDEEISVTDVRRARDVLCAQNLFTKRPKLASSIAGLLGSAGFGAIGASFNWSSPEQLTAFIVIFLGGIVFVAAGVVIQIVH